MIYGLYSYFWDKFNANIDVAFKPIVTYSTKQFQSFAINETVYISVTLNYLQFDVRPG